MNTSDLLLNLKIISKIPEHGKIKRTGNTIALETHIPSYIEGIVRFYRGDSRKKGVSDMEDIILSAIEKCEYIINNREFTGCEEISLNFQKQVEILDMIHEELKKCTEGMINFRTTYHNDATVCSKIDILITRIKNYSKFLDKVTSS